MSKGPEGSTAHSFQATGQGPGGHSMPNPFSPAGTNDSPHQSPRQDEALSSSSDHDDVIELSEVRKQPETRSYFSVSGGIMPVPMQESRDITMDLHVPGEEQLASEGLRGRGGRSRLQMPDRLPAPKGMDNPFENHAMDSTWTETSSHTLSYRTHKRMFNEVARRVWARITCSNEDELEGWAIAVVMLEIIWCFLSLLVAITVKSGGFMCEPYALDRWLLYHGFCGILLTSVVLYTFFNSSSLETQRVILEPYVNVKLSVILRLLKILVAAAFGTSSTRDLTVLLSFRMRTDGSLCCLFPHLFG